MPSSSHTHGEPTPRRWAVGLLLVLGIAIWVFNLRADAGGATALLLLGAAIVIALLASFITPLGRAVDRLLNRIRHPSPASATRTAIMIAIVAGLYLFATAWWQGTHLVPRLSDESSYLIQAQMLAIGRLWYAPHPPEIRPFFDTLNLLVEPTYGSMYFPGTALFYVPAVWLGLPYWIVSLSLSAACAGLLYRVLVDLIDGVYALVGVLMLLGLMMFRALSVMLLSQTPMLLLALLMVLAYIRWRRRFDWRWAAAIGALAGWAGITRPADALCYAVAIGVAMLLDLRHLPAADATSTPAMASTRRTWLKTAACLVLPALPFLSLQVVQNAGMTGHWWEFPEALYADETYPAPMLGFHDINHETWKRPSSPRKRLLSEAFALGDYADHRPANVPRTWWERRLPETFYYGLPHPLLAILLPVGLLKLRTRPRRVLAAALVLFLWFYAFYVFYIPHYMIVIAPPLAMLVLLGGRAVEHCIAAVRPRIGRVLALAIPLSIAGLSIGSLPELNPEERDHEMFPGVEVVYISYLMDELKAELGDRRAIVLFQFDLQTYLRAGEPVYTADVAWPDDSQIVRAADQGPRNVDLFRYFAKTLNQPDRVVYVYDSQTKLLTRIGTAGELANDG